ncbi:MAG: biotin/lipoyl-binding protein [Oligoflexia bacterium]|nr:biotin/lipoyl-binding protein [Oligoflexia bacterium]
MTTYAVNIGEKSFRVELIRRDAEMLTFNIGGNTYEVAVSACLDEIQVQAQSANSPATPRPSASKRSTTNAGQVVAPMPGIVTKLLVKAGDQVNAGQPLLTIEAMKMENSINSPCSGVVRKVCVEIGREVMGQQELVLIG